MKISPAFIGKYCKLDSRKMPGNDEAIDGVFSVLLRYSPGIHPAEVDLLLEIELFN